MKLYVRLGEVFQFGKLGVRKDSKRALSLYSSAVERDNTDGFRKSAAWKYNELGDPVGALELLATAVLNSRNARDNRYTCEVLWTWLEYTSGDYGHSGKLTQLQLKSSTDLLSTSAVTHNSQVKRV